jgi:hypothetical protein
MSTACCLVPTNLSHALDERIVLMTKRRTREQQSRSEAASSAAG